MSKEIKVCHLTSVHPYTDTRIFLKECKYLKAANYDVYLIAPDVKDQIIEGIHVLGVEGNKDSRFNRMTKTVNQVFRRAKAVDADIYHFHDPELITIGLKLKKMGKRVIYDVHEDVPRDILSKHWINKYFRVIIAWIFERYENYAAKEFDSIVTATPYITKRFSLLGCKAININNYPILNEMYAAKCVDYRNRGDTVCYVGSISEIRGIREMVQAVGILENVQLLLAGKFANEDERQSILSEKGWLNVTYLGALNRLQVQEVFSKSLIGLVLFHSLPNHVDAQPNKMFEYMSAGLPVIASNFPLWRNIIEKNNCGICVDPMSPLEISQAIQWFMKNPDEAKKMGENGRRAVEDIFNWENENKMLLQLYQSLDR